jgi:uncharacterized protein (DUF2147 family)
MRHDHYSPRSDFSRLCVGLAGLVMAAGTAAAAANEGPSERGIWINHSGKGAVEIRPCGSSGRDADRLCGFIVWLKDPNNKRGEPLTDGYNTDPAKRRRPICGLPVLGSLRPMTDGSWDQGWVYDPEQGQAFDAAIQLKSADRLILTGYKGVKFFSKSFVWKRAPVDLPRCDGKLERDARAQVPTQAPTQTTATPASTKVARKTTPGPQVTQTGELIPPRPVPAVRPGKISAE